MKPHYGIWWAGALGIAEALAHQLGRTLWITTKRRDAPLGIDVSSYREAGDVSHYDTLILHNIHLATAPQLEQVLRLRVNRLIFVAPYVTLQLAEALKWSGLWDMMQHSYRTLYTELKHRPRTITLLALPFPNEEQTLSIQRERRRLWRNIGFREYNYRDRTYNVNFSGTWPEVISFIEGEMRYWLEYQQQQPDADWVMTKHLRPLGTLRRQAFTNLKQGLGLPVKCITNIPYDQREIYRIIETQDDPIFVYLPGTKEERALRYALRGLENWITNTTYQR